MLAPELRKRKGNQFLGVKAGRDYTFAAACAYNCQSTHSWERLNNFPPPALPQFTYPIPPRQGFAFRESLCVTNKQKNNSVIDGRPQKADFLTNMKSTSCNVGRNLTSSGPGSCKKVTSTGEER